MFWSDIRHSVRSLARLPGFSFVCMITLALGIGATTSIFSAIYHTMMRPMPFANGDRLAYVWVQDSASSMAMAPPLSMVDAWRGRMHSFDAIETYSTGEYTVLGGTEPELVKGGSISQGLPAMLGVQPVAGRVFTDDEMQRNARNVVVLSEGMSKRRFGGARNAIGKQVELGDGTRHEVVGVVPNVFAAFESYQREGQMWFPLRPDTTSFRDVSVIGLLREGATLEAADAELGVVAAGVKLEHQLAGKWAPKVMTPQNFIDGTTKAGLPILFGAVSAVLLIGCANIAGLLLVRLNSRRRELSIRAAVGARRFAILRLLAAESLVLALGGGVLGIAIASWLTSAIRRFRPDTLNSLDAIALDRPSVMFALAVSLGTALFFGIGPVIAAMRRNLTDGLISNAGSSARVTTGNRLRSIMVGGQIALSLILLVASLLLVRSVRQMQNKDLGFSPRNVITMGVYLKDGSPEATNKAFFDALLPAIRRLPGVTDVSVSTGVPSKGGMMLGQLEVAGRELTAQEQTNMVGFTGASPEYLKAVGLRLKEGRFFTADEKGSPIVINESWAKQLWPRESALGKQMRMGPQGDFNTVVGVVGDISTMGAKAKSTRPHMYTPYSYSFPRGSIAVRVNGRDAGSLASDLRAVLREADATLVARDVATLEDLMADTIALDRFYMMLLTAFAALALLLSVIGLYGVISNTVAQRTREIGVRMALGATAADVRSLIFRQGVRIVGVGLVVGTVAALMLVRLLKSALNGFSGYDPVSYTVAAVVLTLGAAAAIWIPSRRAVRVDPLDALRAE